MEWWHPKFLKVVGEGITLEVFSHRVLAGQGLFGVSFMPSRERCQELFSLFGVHQKPTSCNILATLSFVETVQSHRISPSSSRVLRPFGTLPLIASIISIVVWMLTFSRNVSVTSPWGTVLYTRKIYTYGIPILTTACDLWKRLFL